MLNMEMDIDALGAMDFDKIFESDFDGADVFEEDKAQMDQIREKTDASGACDHEAEMIELRSLMKQVDLAEMMAGAKTRPARKKLDTQMLEKLVVPEVPFLEPCDEKAMRQGDTYKATYADDYHVETPVVLGGDLSRLKGSFIQSRVCAALNSHKKLAIVLGLDKDMKMVGVQLDRSGRDRLMVGVDCCMSRGFSPTVPACMYDMKMYRLEDILGHVVPDHYIIIFTVDMIANQMYQLLNGKAYIIDKGEVQLITWNEAKVKFEREMALYLKKLAGDKHKMTMCTIV